MTQMMTTILIGEGCLPIVAASVIDVQLCDGLGLVVVVEDADDKEDDDDEGHDGKP